MMWSFVLAVIHWYLRLWISITALWRRLNAVVHWTFDAASDGVIRKRLTTVERLPVHLSLVFVEDDLSFSDIVRLVTWSTAAGIAYVTIYDHRGICKKNKDTLLTLLKEQRQRLWDAKHVSNIPQSNGMVNNGLLNHYNASNNAESEKNLSEVFIIGPDDGRQGIVDLTKQLSSAVVSHQTALSDLSVSGVDMLLQAKYGFPDPDLVLKFGRVNSLLGFLPWHMRLAEIMSIPTHHHIRFQEFFDAIVAFTHTEQRFGK